MFVRKGQKLGSVLVDREVVASTEPGPEPVETTPAPEPEPEPEETAVEPAKYASKGDWVDYAVSQGADREEAESSTKDELIQAYGTVKEASDGD